MTEYANIRLTDEINEHLGICFRPINYSTTVHCQFSYPVIDTAIAFGFRDIILTYPFECNNYKVIDYNEKSNVGMEYINYNYDFLLFIVLPLLANKDDIYGVILTAQVYHVRNCISCSS